MAGWARRLGSSKVLLAGGAGNCVEGEAVISPESATFFNTRFLRRRALRSLVASEPIPGGTVRPFWVEVLDVVCTTRDVGLRDDWVSGDSESEDVSESLSELELFASDSVLEELEEAEGGGANLRLFTGFSSVELRFSVDCLTLRGVR